MIVEPRSIILDDVEALGLSYGSMRKVAVMCPVCGDVRKMRWGSIVEYGHTHCRGCSTLKDLRGHKYGRLTPLYPLYSTGGNREWLCQCDCGETAIVRSHHLRSKSGPTTSCGCYGIERSRAQTRELNPQWNPNKTDEERLSGRSNDVRYIEWAKLVKQRDSYKCQVCGRSVSNGLVSHHLYAWRDYPEGRYELSNGICLCKECHIDFHSKYGSGNNTEGQFLEYLNEYN